MSGRDRFLRAASEALASREGCPEADLLRRLALDEAGEAEELQAAGAHAADCDACAAAVAFLREEPEETGAWVTVPASVRDRSDRLVESVTGLDVVGAPVAEPPGPPAARAASNGWAFRLAASLVLAGSLGVMGWIWSQGGLFQDDVGRFRAARALELLAPRGELVVAPRVFRWTGHPRAASYRIILLDEEMQQVWDGVTGTEDTELEIPPDGLPSRRPGAWLTWQVVALGELGEEIARSPAAHFRLAGGRPSG